MMLLDEPTASMDAQTEVRVMTHLFQEVKPDSTLVIVTHKPNFLPLVQRIIVVDRGRIVIDGPRDEVLNRLRQAAAQPQKTVAANAQTPGTTPLTVTVSS
jgi:ATP-binding cassette subfamily C protein LapB